MARMPGAIWVGEQSPRTPMSRYDGVIVHTIVGYAPAHAAHFSVKGDGTILQSRDTAYRSAACLDGNHRLITIENEDHGELFPDWTGSNVPALTVAQVAANARILGWSHEVHGCPLQLMPDSRPTSRGLGYHRLGIDGNFTDGYAGRVSGGEVWTEHYGKVCPGKARIDQVPAILAAALGEEPDVGAELDDDIYRDDREVSVRSVLQRMDRFLSNQSTHRTQLLEALDGVEQELKASDDDTQAKIERVLRRLGNLRRAIDAQQDEGPASPPT